MICGSDDYISSRLLKYVLKRYAQYAEELQFIRQDNNFLNWLGASICKNNRLKTLRICTARDFGQGIILKVITLLPLLQTLQISHSPMIHIKVLLDILKQLPNLKVLDLVHCISLDNSHAILLQNYMLENKVLQTFYVGEGDGKVNSTIVVTFIA